MDISNTGWWKVCDLGHGGFGYVTLLQNETDKEYIAIKRCHQKTMETPSIMERWKKEVLIMGTLQHENVIQAIELPPELQAPPGEAPILAMEYCEGGDLRKILNLPQNCCGLRESEIRQLVLGIGSAIEYLHGKRIIHRDLKPENIVLKKEDKRIIYKIIDLGYVKQLGNNSICTSFVGTMQYLAPELNTHQSYTKTVDYWSFGSLVFECITGKRPFLPDATPVQWHGHIQRKSPEDICAQFNERREAVFSRKLLRPNHLCRPIEGYLEEWLRLMLRWDSKSRGGGILKLPGRDRPKCFFLMEQIMRVKIFHILYVEANNVMSFCVREENSIGDVQSEIENVTGVKVSDQVIIQAEGQLLKASQPAFFGCIDTFLDDIFVFLFSQATVKESMIKRRTPPAPVQTILRERDICLIPKVCLGKEQKKVWARAVLWCCEQKRDFKQLMLSQRAALLCILQFNDKNNKQKVLMGKEMNKLSACKEHFQRSLEVDLKYLKQKLNNFSENDRAKSIQIYDRWLENGKQVEAMMSSNKQLFELDKRMDELSTKVHDLQKNPFGKSKSSTLLDEREEKAKALYSSLTSALKNGNQLDQEEMAKLIRECFTDMESLCKTLYTHISKVIVCLSELQPALPKLLDEETKIISVLQNQILALQQQRQEEIWELMDTRMIDLTPNVSQMQPATALNEGPFHLLGSGASLISSMANSNMESLHLVNDCKAHSERIHNMVDSMFQAHEESMSFLDGTLEA